MEGRILSSCGKHPDRRIQCGCDLEKVVGGDDIDLKRFDASRLVAHLGSKQWSQRKNQLVFHSNFIRLEKYKSWRMWNFVSELWWVLGD